MLKKISSLVFAFSLALPWVAAGPVDAAALKKISWKWSDGVAGGSRTLSQSKYKSASNLPTIDVTIKPRAIPRIASLQYWNGDEWIEENRGQSVNGKVSFVPDPMCDGGWCNGSFSYRLIIEPSGDQPKFSPSEFTLTFQSSRSSSSSGGNSSGGSSSGSSSSGGGGVSAAYFIGWNLEDVQDYLGYDPRTSDCSGWGRSVWWSSNWWVINAYNGVLIVSKSRSSCS